MSNHKLLKFFNKEGDNLNFNYSDVNDRFEGTIMFNENSSDTFKTQGIYMLEKIPSFDFEYPGYLNLNRFQLFNEFGFDFYKGISSYISISKIEPINNDPNFYSKWIYGEQLDIISPIGSIIQFKVPFLEFTNPLQTYTIVAVKKGAIMIISSVDNATFETIYNTEYLDDTLYTDKTISIINAIGIYNYISDTYSNNLSYWNELNFYDKLYKRKKLNIIGSDYNDGVLTVLDDEITDVKFFEYYADSSLVNNDLIIEIASKMDLPKIYEGSIQFEYIQGTWSTPEFNNLIFSKSVPDILKPNKEFKIIGSTNNTNFFTVANIPNFTGNTQQTFYATQSQVLYNNKIYQCILAYTQSYALSDTFTITPENTDYWTNSITHIQVNEKVTPEYLSMTQVYLTTDKIYLTHGFTQSGQVTLASAADKYITDLKSFNVELYYENNKIKADLSYSSKYVEVNFYNGSLTQSIGNVKQTYEKLIQVSEPLKKELNYNFSSNHSLNIVFTDLDEYGLKIKIDKQVYEEEISYIYSGISIDMERTIDRTLRAWLSRNFIELQKLGIKADLQYIGTFTSPFYNSIKLSTDYPNVSMYINEILVGSTANYYIEHSNVLFYDLGNYLSITINDDTYDINTIYLNGSQYPDIPNTLRAWVKEHSNYLATYGFIVSSINNLLKFDTKYQNRILDYSIKTGKSSLPGIHDYIITNKIKGNNGVLIASNEVVLDSSVLGTYSFEDAGFATGMVFSLNNTYHTWNNTEFNIQLLDPNILNISYQGPFWGTLDDNCNISPFVTVAFDLGFGQIGCTSATGGTGATGATGSIGGQFDIQAFSASQFSLSSIPNTYTTNTYDLKSYQGTDNLVDILYIQLSNSIYAFGDGLVVLDAYLGEHLADINLPGNTQSLQMEFNPINNYLYCISKNLISVVDPLINTVVKSMTFSNIISDVEINTNNGDFYITYEDSNNISIYNYNNIFVVNAPNSGTSGKMVFNVFEKDMYITGLNEVLRIDGTNRTNRTDYNISGVTGSIFYEPVNESVYCYGITSSYKIDNGSITTVSVIPTTSFSDIIYNNFTGHMDISDTMSVKGLDLNDSIYFNSSIGAYGYMALNQYDGDIYLSSKSSNGILVLKSSNGVLLYTELLSANTDKIIYNPERKSVWTIQPSTKSIIEVDVKINSRITNNVIKSESINDNQYGTLDSNYIQHENIWIKTKEYLRKPRENYTNETKVNYYWQWYSDIAPEFFIYDFSGNQLSTNGSYSYLGSKPLSPIVLNKTPNKDLTKIYSPEYQQTIFDSITYSLSYIDDEEDISVSPEPLELFIGFKSEDEGALRSILQLYKNEDVELVYKSEIGSDLNITFETLDPDGPNKRGYIKINTNSDENFLNKGLKVDQLITLYLKDVTNQKNQYISDNNGTIVKIRNIYYKNIIVDFLDKDNDYLFMESTLISNYPNIGNTTYCQLTIKVIDREIGRFIVHGQTEIEDMRFKIELGNTGKLIAPNEVFIFKDYDILEGGIDWLYLNKKRKEMLMMKHLIYPYIGAYKSIINAINFFGYNDLKLNEYYRNINPDSEKFYKLFKQEIPDIFDNTVSGWSETDFITNNFPNDDYEETNMFNLTYQITDKDGNNVINYSIDEIIIKLQGLKYWLKKNIIPLTHKILDITGSVFFNNTIGIVHTSYDVQIVNIRQNMTPITFKLNEAYLMPINSGSAVYNCVIDFYSMVDNAGADKNPTSLINPPTAFNGAVVELPDYFDITIKTYKTYKEWNPFTTYNYNDKVIYYGKIYESVIDNNKIKNPRKYENISSWKINSIYSETNIIEYDRDIYIHNGTESNISSIPPSIDNGIDYNWLKITEWKEIDYEPVQRIKEFRQIISGTTSNPILPFNFTIDANIDPFIVIEVTTDNGYGLVYRDKKNYEIRTLKDLTQPTTYIDQIGSFQPIIPIV